MPSPKPVSKSFSATLTAAGNRIRWVLVRMPFDSVKVWGVRGHLRVKGEINGFAFRGSLFPAADGHHMLMVNKKMQTGAKVRAGMTAKFRIEPDLEERPAPAAPELDKALRVSRRLLKFFQSLPQVYRRDMARRVADAKQPETRRRRAEQFAEWLMETMEAEIELPPLLQQAFRQNPEASARWQRMTPVHRRRRLLSVFYYKTHDARLRRIDQLMNELTGRGKDEW
jgi:uncharacterized protein YdeI (YjbR/CyaY-like superfamily)